MKKNAKHSKKHSEKNNKTESKKESNQISSTQILIGLAAAIVIGFFVLTAFGPKPNYDALADCLNEKGIIMAGTDWCPACKSQKEKFGESFSKVPYKDCDIETEWCTANNIPGYPTWVFPNGTQASGVKDYTFLSETAGCEITTE